VKAIPALKEHWPIIILSLAFLIFNMMNIENYGISWDEPAQRSIGLANIDYLTGKADSVSLPSDLPYYGPFYETLNIVFAQALKNTTELSDIAAHHYLGILLSTIGIVFLYLLARKLFDNKIAIYSAIFFVLFPQFIAHTHYNTKDIPLMNLTIITIFIMYLAFKVKDYKYILLSGILFGITLDIKIIALEILPIFFIPYLAGLIISGDILKNHETLKVEIKLISLFAISTAISVFIFWPALWQSPDLFGKSILYFINHPWSGEVLYFGKFYLAGELPRHYATVQLFIATPIITFVCLIPGLYLTIKQLLSKKEGFFEALLVVFWLLLPLLMATMPGTTVYDGIRQFFIILPAISILAALGLQRIIQLLKTKYPKYGIQRALPAAILIILAINLIEIHPYEGSYVNEITRMMIPAHIEDSFEMEFWGTTYRDGTNWLNKNAIQNSTVYVAYAPHLMQYYDIRPDLRVNSHGIKPVKYIMFFTRDPTLLRSPIFDNSTPIYKITRYNSDLLYIFEMDIKTNPIYLGSYFQAFNGQYVSADGGGGGRVMANSTAIGPWETFKLVDLGNDTVAIQTYSGQYVGTVNQGGREVVASSAVVGPWETFKFIDLGNDTVAIQTYNGRYISAGGRNSGEVVANSTSIGPWETFRV